MVVVLVKRSVALTCTIDDSGGGRSLTMQEDASETVSKLQEWMQKENMDCFIVPSDDPHLR